MTIEKEREDLKVKTELMGVFTELKKEFVYLDEISAILMKKVIEKYGDESNDYKQIVLTMFTEMGKDAKGTV